MSKTASTTPAPATKPAPAPANCGCGCGQPALTAKGTFLPGHDARLAGVLGRAIGDGTATDAQRERVTSLSPALAAKVVRIALGEANKKVERDAKAAAKVAAEKAYKETFEAYLAEHKVTTV